MCLYYGVCASFGDFCERIMQNIKLRITQKVTSIEPQIIKRVVGLTGVCQIKNKLTASTATAINAQSIENTRTPMECTCIP